MKQLGQQVLGGGFHVELEVVGEGIAQRLKNVPGVTAVEAIGANHLRLLADHDVRSDVAAAAVAAGGRLFQLSIEEPSLEMIYTSYFHKLQPSNVS